MSSDLNYLQQRMEIDATVLTEQLCCFIKAKTKELKRSGVIVGLSGGLDSAVISKLCKEAVGKEQVKVLLLPEKGSAQKHLLQACQLAEDLGLDKKIISITPHLKRLGIYRFFPVDLLTESLRGKIVNKLIKLYNRKFQGSFFLNSLQGTEELKWRKVINRALAYYRAKHRMRLVMIYLHGELENRLIVGASNRSEYLTGLFVKFGIDDSADIMPLFKLYKTQVIQLAQFLKLPADLIHKAPSPDLIAGLDDQSVLGLDYQKLDLILLALDLKWSPEKIICALEPLGIARTDIDYLVDLKTRASHMQKVQYPCL